MEKPEINNENYDERSAGGIVYRRDEGKIVWLVIKTYSRKRFPRGNDKNGHSKERFIYKFPKGHLMEGEFLKQAAIREVEEEGQIKARVLTKVGSRDYVISDRLLKRKIIKKVTFYLMEYLGESRLRHFDKEAVLAREWFSFEEARERLAYESEKALLGKAARKLGRI